MHKTIRLIIVIFTLILLTVKLYPQPGGGGGLIIQSFYNSKLEKINSNDSTLQIRAFTLADTSFDSKITKELHITNYYILPPLSQRLLIFYQKDTMIIDFHGIVSENGGGYIDRIDSIVIQPGHFRIFLHFGVYWQINSNDNGIFFYEVDTLIDEKDIYANCGYGLTPHTIDFFSNFVLFVFPPEINNNSAPALIRKQSPDYFFQKADENDKYSVIEYFSRIDTTFLLDENLPATFYLQRGAYYISQNNVDSALTDIYKSLQKGLHDEEKEEFLMLLCSAYTQKEVYDSAIRYISDLIKIRSDQRYKYLYGDFEQLKDSYRNRIELYIKSNQLIKVLQDYDSLVYISAFYLDNGILVSNSEYNTDANIERALFKMKYLKDCKGAIIDLKSKIDSIPDNHMSDRPGGTSEYSDTYFTLGLAEYCYGNKKLAFKYWLKAEELGYEHSSSEVAVTHFDSLIQKFPKVPELYLSRALAHCDRCAFLGWGEETTQCFIRALNDVNNAEKLGMKDCKINLYRAKILYLQKNYEEALKQINIAVSKNNHDARIYLWKYWIKDKMGLVKNRESKTDPDFIKYTELCKSWKFEK